MNMFLRDDEQAGVVYINCLANLVVRAVVMILNLFNLQDYHILQCSVFLFQ